ncbi:hypothetical protein M405DRAFT_866019 [Rhizopogon salebrosus TDB-379]|nr:hypothetical protein M405DRAFT_866019 [Rhizopogon salebrosus TDB-379]
MSGGAMGNVGLMILYRAPIEIQCYTRPPYPPTPSRYIRLGGKDFNNGLVNHIMIPALAVFLGIDGNGILNIFPSDKTADKLNVYVYWGEGLLLGSDSPFAHLTLNCWNPASTFALRAQRLRASVCYRDERAHSGFVTDLEDHFLLVLSSSKDRMSGQ